MGGTVGICNTDPDVRETLPTIPDVTVHKHVHAHTRAACGINECNEINVSPYIHKMTEMATQVNCLFNAWDKMKTGVSGDLVGTLKDGYTSLDGHTPTILDGEGYQRLIIIANAIKTYGEGVKKLAGPKSALSLYNKWMEKAVPLANTCVENFIVSSQKPLM